MEAGALRSRVSFRKFVEVDDLHGGFTETALAIRDRVAAEISALAGRDLELARQVDPRASHLVTVRYWANYHDDLIGGRVQAIWHDALKDRTLEVVEPPRERVARTALAMICKEAA